jgi:hypothetical protein
VRDRRKATEQARGWRPTDSGKVRQAAGTESLQGVCPEADRPGRPPGADIAGPRGARREPRAFRRACGSSIRGRHRGPPTRGRLIPFPRRMAQAGRATSRNRAVGSDTAVRPAGGRPEEVPQTAAEEHSGAPKGAGPDEIWASEMGWEPREVAPDPLGPPGPNASRAFLDSVPSTTHPVAGVPAGLSGRGRVSSHTARTGWRHRRRSRGSSDKPGPSEFSRA